MFQSQALVAEIVKLRGFAMRLTKNPADAEDLVQATLLRALEKKEYFLEGTSLFSWTSRIMFNLFASAYRHHKKFGTSHDPEPYIGRTSVKPAQEACVDLAIVREAMKRLKPQMRNVLIAICIKGLRYEEVSELMQIPVGTVRSRLSRARKQLQELLASSQDDTTRRMPMVPVSGGISPRNTVSLGNI
ncbi:MAG: RNA polymerase sigma factor [Alphaproteobacteria bacterium]